MSNEHYLWTGFGIVVLVLLILDLGVFHRAAHSIRLREAAAWTGIWVLVALLFCGVIYANQRFVRKVEPGALVEVTVPSLGGTLNIQSADAVIADIVVADVLVERGRDIKAHTPVITLRAGDASLDVPSPVEGDVEEILVAKGDTVPEGTPIFRMRQPNRALEFLTGYIIEWSLSMDNVFVFAVIFGYFAVPARLQHRVLFWGILGAVVMRLAFVVAGSELLERYHWLIYVLGAFLIFTGLKLLRHRNASADVSRNPLLRIARWCLPVTSDYVEQRFFVRLYPDEARSGQVASGAHAGGSGGGRGERRRLYATPLLLVLLVIESTDVAFAVDSIPAIFGVTEDRFIIFSSNVFAILGLRSLYFLLAGSMDLFRYLKVGLAAILCFVGVKMLLPLVSIPYKIPTGISLAVVCGILALAVLASLLFGRSTAKGGLPHADETPP